MPDSSEHSQSSDGPDGLKNPQKSENGGTIKASCTHNQGQHKVHHAEHHNCKICDEIKTLKEDVDANYLN